MTILFHDVGNFFKREYHNQNIQKIINDLFSQFFYGEFRRERNHIIAAGRAHTGKSSHGTSNTLGDISEQEHCGGERVKLRDIAAIVRLADELAEGPQRTCQYQLDLDNFTPESKIYHKYASCTHLMIDALNGRISITYEIDIGSDKENEIPQEKLDELHDLLEIIYKRIVKLDQERKYCAYYCDALKAITETRVSFNFTNHDQEIDYKIEPLILTDLTLPGDESKGVTDGRKDLEIDTILKGLSSVITGKEPSHQALTNIKTTDDVDRPKEQSIVKDIFNFFRRGLR